MEELEKLAAEQGIDLDELDQRMRSAAQEEPGSVERMLLESNLSRECRLRLGVLIHLLLLRSKCIEEVRAWVVPLVQKGRANKGDLEAGLTIIAARTGLWEKLAGPRLH